MNKSNFVVLRAFGNDFEAYVYETALPLAIARLSPQLTMPKLITVDASDEFKQVGEIARITKPVTFDSADEFTEGGSTASALNVEKVDVKLDRHIYKEFAMSDREFTGMQPGVIPDALGAAVDVLARSINAAIFDLYKEVNGFSGDLGSENSRTKVDLIKARQEMHGLNVFGDKKLVLTPDSEGDFLQIFTAGNDQSAEKDGNIGRRIGFDIYSDNQAPYHIAGTASAKTTLVTGIEAAAGSAMVVVGGAADGDTYMKGDVLTVAGQRFTVTANAAAGVDGSAVVSVTPAVGAAIPSGSSVVVADSHRVDLAFSPSAFVAVFRQLETPNESNAATVGTMTDPNTGVTLRLVSWYDPKTTKTHWKLETLFGVKAVAPERAIRVGGH